jgi:hypothetical protein
MEFDPAGQMERIVALLGAHPFASVGALIAILLILGFQKDGLFSKIFGYLEARANHEAALEQRRTDIILMLENRSQRDLPGLEGEIE